MVNVTALGLCNSLPRDWSNTHQQPIVICVNCCDIKWDTSATKSHGAGCTASKIHSSCLLISSYDSCLWEFGPQFSYFPWFPVPLVHPTFLLSSWHLHQEASSSRSPAGTGAQKILQGEAVLGSRTSTFARSLPLASSWLATGSIVPIRNFSCYKLEASYESVITTLLQRCVTKPNFGVFSGKGKRCTLYTTVLLTEECEDANSQPKKRSPEFANMYDVFLLLIPRKNKYFRHIFLKKYLAPVGNARPAKLQETENEVFKTGSIGWH